MNLADLEIVEEKKTNRQISANEITEKHIVVSGKRVNQKWEMAVMGAITAIDTKTLDYWESLGDDEDQRERTFKKEIYPLLQWLSCVGDPDWETYKREKLKTPPLKDNSYTAYHLIAINEALNNIKDLQNHPKIVWMLMQYVGIGTKMNHGWISFPKKSKTKSSSLIDEFIEIIQPSCNQQEKELFLTLYSKKEIIEMAEGLGWDDIEIKKLMEEYEKI